ncbi:MAG: hypothetical protein QUT30_07630 [Acidobacteriota bacterium]|jgi:hypothetical protein|nr:hypothetical protein [Acidobacteriota bacterium]
MTPDKADITLGVGPDGKLEYSNDAFKAERGQKLTWQCEHPFAIQFRDISPLDEGRSPHPADRGQMKGTVKRAMAPGEYKYACAVYSNGTVYLDAACPAIIIE